MLPLLLLLLTHPALAQERSLHEVAPQPRPAVAIRDHGHDPVVGPLGTWAAGDDYKCCFDQGTFTMIPYVGKAAARNLPWSWTTTEAVLGATDLLEGEPGADAHTEYRFTRRRGLVTERWDVRADGVAQSFVIAAAPDRGGDLLVRGRIDGELAGPRREAKVAPLEFADRDGLVRLVYGEALAIDAKGETCQVPAAFDGKHLELRVPAAFVDGASFPLTIDPLVDVWVLGSGALPGAGSGTVDQDVDRVASSDRMGLVRTEVRWASALDGDLYVTRSRDDFGVTLPIYSDLSTTYSAYDASVAAMDLSRTYLVAWSRGIQGQGTTVSWFLHGADATTTPVLRTASHPSGWYERAPRLGGRKSGGQGSRALALLVRIRDRADGTGTSEIWGSTIDTIAATEGTPFQIAGSGQLLVQDHDRPWVSRDVVGEWDDWMVAYQTYADLTGHWQVRVRRVDRNGALDARTFYPDLPPGTPPQAMEPRIEGAFGRYLVAFTTASSTAYPGKLISGQGTEVRAQRFDWPNNGNAPLVAHPLRTLAIAGSRTLELGGIAHDSLTRSHWVVAQGASGSAHRIHRLGYRGITIDSATVPLPATGTSVPRAPALAFDRTLERFPIFYGVRQTVAAGQIHWLLYGGRYEHPAQDPPSWSGGCGSAAIGYSLRFRIGTEAPSIVYFGTAPQQPAVALLSLATADLRLSDFGIGGGCSVLVDPSAPNLFATVALVTDAQSRALLSFPLLETFSTVDFHAQWIAPGASPGTLLTTARMSVEVR